MAKEMRDSLPWRMKQRFKAIHIMPKLHEGHLTVRIFMTTQTAEDPEPYIFAKNDLA